MFGRPAPEGSHDVGQHGKVMHASKFLPAWRAAVKHATYKAYQSAGLPGEALPLVTYPRPLWVTVWHIVTEDQCRARDTDEPTGKPDGDKLLRATVDGLGDARAFGDDSQIIGHRSFKIITSHLRPPGAQIEITDVRPWWAHEQMREIENVGDQSFTPNGQYRLELSRVGTDNDGDRTWETVIEVTDEPDAILETWLFAVHGRMTRALDESGEQAPAQTTEPKAPRGRPRKATAAPVEQPAAAPAPAPAPEPTPAPAPAVSEPQAPPAAPVAAPARVNPFAR